MQSATVFQIQIAVKAPTCICDVKNFSGLPPGGERKGRKGWEEGREEKGEGKIRGREGKGQDWTPTML
jgi:hypothetical protein